jgi:lipopolysaccharide export system permease protein
MTILDRYLLRLYLKVLIVSFVSLAGLYVVIDGFGNLDEFLSYGKRHAWGTAGVLAEYYGPRLLQFFDQITGLLAMLGSMFVLTVLARANELTALLAAGIAPSRVLQPLLGASILVAGLGVANREIGLPSVRDSLSRNAQDWLGETGRKCTPRYDIRTDILIAGQATYANEKRLAAPRFALPHPLPPELVPWGRQVVAENAFYLKATNDRPAGYLLRGVSQPANWAELSSVSIGGQPILFSPADTPWLKPDECFVASVVTFEQLVVGSSWRQNLSSYELVAGLRGQTIEPGADVRLTLHARCVQPLLDLSLVLLGIPLVLSRASRNIFVAAGIGLGLVAALLVIKLACHALGNNYLLSATLAAWLPLLIFGPLAFTFSRPLWD